MSAQLKLSTPNLGGRFNQTHPTEFGKYKVVRFLESGGFGSVYLVQDSTGKMFVLKVSNSKNAIYLEIEYYIGCTILNPCFVPALELFEEGEYKCLLFEYVPGQTLTNFLRLPRSNNVKKLIIQQIALAISHLHGSMRIAHLDLKPDNILIVMQNGFPRVKIIDFGLASPFAFLAPGRVGTPNYMAPEVRFGFKYDQSADIWSLGMVIVYILTGQVPAVTGTHPRNAVLFQICTMMQPPIPDQIKYDPEMSWGLSLCQACLQIDPNMRPCAAKFVEMCASLKFD
jgi:serine/threonine protein kinase